MYIKNKWLFMAYKVLFVVICGYGLWLQFGKGAFWGLNYYTNLSNIVCFVYFLWAVFYNVGLLWRGEDTATWKPRLEGAVVFCITVTFLIYHFLLSPITLSNNPERFYSMGNLTVHYIVPIMVVLDWLLFCPKGMWKKLDPLSWLLIPLVYFVYILVRAQFAGNIGFTNSPYPYGFIDVQLHGWSMVMRNVALTAVGMLALAYLIYFIDLGMARLGILKKIADIT